MIPVLLIAGNYVREQRWVVLSLGLYAVGMAILLRIFEPRISESDVIALAHQQASFTVLFAIVFAASAIDRDRRSRRILGTLSKAVHRYEYLAGLLLGVWCCVSVYVLAAILVMFWLSPSVAFSHGLTLMVTAFVAATTASGVTIFFTTFMPPFLATMASGILFASPILVKLAGLPVRESFFPLYHLAIQIASGEAPVFRPDLLLYALIQTIAFWLLASLVFSFRDIAVPVE